MSVSIVPVSGAAIHAAAPVRPTAIAAAAAVVAAGTRGGGPAVGMLSSGFSSMVPAGAPMSAAQAAAVAAAQRGAKRGAPEDSVRLARPRPRSVGAARSRSRAGGGRRARGAGSGRAATRARTCVCARASVGARGRCILAVALAGNLQVARAPPPRAARRGRCVRAVARSRRAVAARGSVWRVCSRRACRCAVRVCVGASRLWALAVSARSRRCGLSRPVHCTADPGRCRGEAQPPGPAQDLRGPPPQGARARAAAAAWAAHSQCGLNLSCHGFVPAVFLLAHERSMGRARVRRS